MARTTTRNPIRPLVALRAVRKLVDNPQDTARVFEIVRALSGNALARTTTRFERHPTGARILRERRSLLQTLTDRDALAALPDGSLGRAYLDFCERENITADGLVAASMEDRPPEELSDEHMALVGARTRDMHDLWHVVTGYQTDLLGEAAVLAFSVPQVRNPGIAFIVLTACVVAGRRGSFVRKTLGEAFLRGLRAEWLVAADWEALLSQPLTQVQRDLGLGDTHDYTRIYGNASQPTVAAAAA